MDEAIQIDWIPLAHERDPNWACWHCLYAYIDADDHTVLYIGKADRCTVRERWKCEGKAGLHEWATAAGVEGVHLQVGIVHWGVGRRYSAAMLADIESLLIHCLQPPGNIQATQSRISRPGLFVQCNGRWPHRKRLFLDD